MTNLAGWQSGYAAACKAVYAGSIPASASIYIQKTIDIIATNIWTLKTIQ